MAVGYREVVVRRNSAEVREVVRERLADSVGVAPAVRALGDHADHVDAAADPVGVRPEAECGRRDALHAGARVDHEHDRKAERLGDRGRARPVAVVQPHGALDDADVALAAGVVPTKSVLTL